MKHRSLLAGIEQVQRHAALFGLDGGLDVQLVGQRAGRARQATLVGQTLVDRRWQRYLRQLFLALAQAIGGVATGGGQARQRFAVRVDKVERRGEIAARRGARR